MVTSSSFGFPEIVEALRQAGVQRGETIKVYSRLFSLGVPSGVESVAQIPDLYLRAIQEVIGKEGPLVVPTYTTSFGRFGKPFVLESSPSEMGKFSEYVRTRPGVLRSLHPIHSMAALGPKAAALTADHPRWNVGHDTLWERLRKEKARIVTVGLPPRQCMSVVHHIESLACAPYVYHKILRGEVMAGGERVPHDFFMSVRYLQFGIAWDLTRLENVLLKGGWLKKAPLGGDALWSVPFQAVFDACLAGLRKDPYYILEKTPAFVPGEVPLDGISSEREKAPPSGYLEILE